ncbi:hypothetical protein DCAR_0209025 [Daucus carota subsp. sativus]|uniref:Uncharacterized protein n=1 Tax=Daucus carota subsp. sativus TaxID=79200 RepID=A0AAF0WJM9_DAUCS|nr:hypothetical protein DCAR_0209025 [Daucus carota subsp. sativus]
MSTSKSSSASNASVNNSLKSYKSYRNASSVDYRYGNMKCKCDIVSPLQEAWKETTQDPDPMKKCNFFLWADPPYTDRAREVIHGLKEKLKMKDVEVQKLKEELSFVERKMLVIDEERVTIKKKMDEAAAMVKEKAHLRTKKMLCFIILVCCVLILFK